MSRTIEFTISIEKLIILKIMKCNEMEILSEYAISQPQSACAAFIYGEQHRFNYFLRTISGMEKYLEPLDKVINEKFLPALFGTPTSPIDR